MHADKPAHHSNFRRFFFRGIGILLPSVLTIWILIAAYGFVQNRIAEPINALVREAVVQLTPWPAVLEQDLIGHEAAVRADTEREAAFRAGGYSKRWLRVDLQRVLLNQWWRKYAFPMNLIGLVLAVMLIYAAGALVGSYIGSRLVARGEELVLKLPIVKQVYPSVKQVTEFLFGSDKQKIQFNKVVAVEYPRRGIWSVGLMTGDPMRAIRDRVGGDCVTIFIPSSPTPFTGYVITALKEDTIDLPIAVEDALRFVISGGVLVPPSQQIEPSNPPGTALPEPLSGQPEKSPSGHA